MYLKHWPEEAHMHRQPKRLQINKIGTAKRTSICLTAIKLQYRHLGCFNDQAGKECLYFRSGVSKLRIAGQIRSAKQFHPAHQAICQ